MLYNIDTEEILALKHLKQENNYYSSIDPIEYNSNIQDNINTYKYIIRMIQERARNNAPIIQE